MTTPTNRYEVTCNGLDEKALENLPADAACAALDLSETPRLGEAVEYRSTSAGKTYLFYPTDPTNEGVSKPCVFALSEWEVGKGNLPAALAAAGVKLTEK